MRPADVQTDAPTAEELLRRLEQLPSPTPEALEALAKLLRKAEEPPAAGSSAAWPPLLQHAHGKHDVRYAEPATSHRGWVGLPLVLAKRSFRTLFQPFINEVLRKQVEFNEALLEALARMHELQQESLRSEALWRKQVEEQLRELRELRQAVDASHRDTPPARSAAKGPPAAR